MAEPKFTKQDKVWVTYPGGVVMMAYVENVMWKDGRWIYQVQHCDPDKPEEMFSNWTPEHWMKPV